MRDKNSILSVVCHSAFVIAALAGCGGTPAEKLETLDDLRPFLRLEQGNQWTYSRRDNLRKVTEQLLETIDQVEGTDTERITLRSVVQESEVESLETLALTDAGLERHEAAGVVLSPPMQILKLPISTGGSWETKPGITTELGKMDLPTTATLSREKVTVPSGTYDALVVTLKNVTGTYKTWYVRDIGKVKQVMKGPNVDAELELISFQPKD